MRSGGGQVLDNLWRWGKTEPSRYFKLLDDGGLSVDYDGDPGKKWSNVMWKGALADACMEVGAAYFLAEFGGSTSVNTNVRFLDADMRIMPNSPSTFERSFTVPDGAAYVEMYVSLSGEEKPQRFTSYPMLVRGSTRPAGFVPPSKAGGGLVELWPSEMTAYGELEHACSGRIHHVTGKAVRDWDSCATTVTLEPGRYAFSVRVFESTGSRAYVEVGRKGATKMLEAPGAVVLDWDGGGCRLAIVARYANEAVDIVCDPSLVRIL